MRDKIKIIFIPTAIVMLGLIGIYTFLHWILFIKLELFGLKEVVTNFGIPAVLAGLAAFILIRPRLKTLNLRAKRGNWRDFYSFILWILLAVPLIITQEYIVIASGELTALNSIDEINKKEQTKFYTLKNYLINKKTIADYSSFDVSGKHNEHFNMHIYIAMPILAKEADLPKSECLAWLGLVFRETISNRLEPTEKEKRYQEFAFKTQKEFDDRDVSKFIYLDRIGNSDEKDGLLGAIKTHKLYKDNQIILTPRNEPFEARNGNKLSWIVGSSSVGLLVWLTMILIPKIDNPHLIRIKAGKPDKKARTEMKHLVEFLKPGNGHFITLMLIYINIGIYVLMAITGLGFISFKGQDLLNWGANYGPVTRSGEWWRLLTSTFLHGGLMHVLANMYGLLFVGVFLEPLLGRTKFLTIYLLTGILGSIASIWWYDATVSVGASGAIFGLYGLFLALMLTKIFSLEFGKSFLLSTIVFVGFNLLMGLIGGIDNAAHIGGLLGGFVAGLVLYPTLRRKQQMEGE